VTIGSCVYVLVALQQIFDSFYTAQHPNQQPSGTLASWSSNALIVWSLMNAASNVACGAMADFLNQRRILCYKSFLLSVMVSKLSLGVFVSRKTLLL
jgi:hypothetical protein